MIKIIEGTSSSIILKLIKVEDRDWLYFKNEPTLRTILFIKSSLNVSKHARHKQQTVNLVC